LRSLKKTMAKNKRLVRPAPSPPRIPLRQVFLFFALLAVLALVVYSPALKGPFLWDDEHLVEDNSYLRSWGSIPKILSTDIGSGAGRQYDFWRPAQILTYLFDSTFWKSDPFGFHLSNVLLHVLAACALFWFAWLVFADRRLAAASALLFVVHPVHTEAVSYISGRADPLLLLFFLLSFCFLIKDAVRPRLSFLVLCLGAYALALMSRESALLLPVLIIVYHVTLKKPVLGRAFSGVLVVSILYILLRATALRSVWPSEPMAGFTLAQRLPGGMAALAGYLRVLIFPVGLHMEYGNRLFAWTDGRVLLGLVILGVLSAALFHKRVPVGTRFGCAWFLAALLPFLNILSPLNAYMAEHWLYLPSVGLFLLAGGWVSRRYERAPALFGAAVALLVLLWGASSFYHNRFWADPVALFERINTLAPESTRARVSLAVTYLAEKRLAEAEALLVGALEKDPKNYVAYNVLGSVYYQMNRKNDAEAAWRHGLAVEGRFAEFYSNLGVLEAQKGDLEEAIFFFKEAIKRNPVNPDSYKNAAVACYNAGRYQEALRYWDHMRGLGVHLDPVLSEKMEKARGHLVVTDI